MKDASKSVAWIHLHPLILVDLARGSSRYRISAGGFKLQAQNLPRPPVRSLLVIGSHTHNKSKLSSAELSLALFSYDDKLIFLSFI